MTNDPVGRVFQPAGHFVFCISLLSFSRGLSGEPRKIRKTRPGLPLEPKDQDGIDHAFSNRRGREERREWQEFSDFLRVLRVLGGLKKCIPCAGKFL